MKRSSALVVERPRSVASCCDWAGGDGGGDGGSNGASGLHVLSSSGDAAGDTHDLHTSGPHHPQKQVPHLTQWS